MHPHWKRLSTVLLCLGILAFFLARGGEDPPETEDAREADSGAIVIPLPTPKAKPLPEQARGVYVLQTAAMRVSLELRYPRAFRFIATRGDSRREATGTWSLTGNRLSLAYTHVNGTPVGEEPQVVVNAWFGKTIELKETGFPGKVVLTKRAMIRQK